MSGSSRSTARIRAKPAASGPEPAPPLANRRRERNRNRIRIRTLLGLGFGLLAIFGAGFFVYYSDDKSAEARELMRVVTPLPAPKIMDLPQFQGEHKESLYWGTYRPHVYLGIRARTPQSLIAGLMWIGIKDGQYFIRHVCQDSDGLSTYGWRDHNGRDYGRQVIVDHGLSLMTSFLKGKGYGSGYGGDWAVRINVQNENLEEAKRSDAILFFYLADEGGNILSVGPRKFDFHEGVLLASGSRKDVDSWELHLKSSDNLEMHHAGFRTPHMHNLTELVQGTLAVYVRRTGELKLPDASEDSPNILVFQISAKLPTSFDIAFVSGTNLKSSRTVERVDSLTGTALTSQLKGKQEDFEEKYLRCFDINDKIINAANDIIESIDKDELARWISIKPDPEDEETETVKKKMDTTHDQLTDALYRKGLALAEVDSVKAEQAPVEESSAIPSGQADQFEENFKELKKWVDIKSPKYCMLLVVRERRNGRLGMALKALNEMIQDDSEPPKKKLYDLKIELLDQIGWSHVASYERRWMHVRFPPSLPVF